MGWRRAHALGRSPRVRGASHRAAPIGKGRAMIISLTAFVNLASELRTKARVAGHGLRGFSRILLPCLYNLRSLRPPRRWSEPMSGLRSTAFRPPCSHRLHRFGRIGSLFPVASVRSVADRSAIDPPRVLPELRPACRTALHGPQRGVSPHPLLTSGPWIGIKLGRLAGVLPPCASAAVGAEERQEADA